MISVQSVLGALEEREIARRVGIPHDETRMRFPLERNTVRDFDDFSNVIGDYYNHHFTTCVSNGGLLSRSEAAGRAKEALERHYRRRNGNIVSAFNDTHDGTNGGLRVILDVIADLLKTEGVERYIRDVFDRHVAPNSFDDKVELIRQFIERCGPDLSTSIQTDRPERYAHDADQLIRAYVDSLRQTSALFRRL
ncbi:MAG: hypothetical protein KAV82_01460 [Phycisphaerae bacterium]|nr:hypothetical protein [Phycisphaerae bacterium]